MEYFHSHVIKFVDISPYALNQWLDRGYFEPSIQKASGSGSRNIFSFTDIVKIALFKQLLGKGIARDVAGRYLAADDTDDIIEGVSIIHTEDPEADNVFFLAFESSRKPNTRIKAYAVQEPYELKFQHKLNQIDLIVISNLTEIVRTLDKKIKEMA